MAALVMEITTRARSRHSMAALTLPCALVPTALPWNPTWSRRRTRHARRRRRRRGHRRRVGLGHAAEAGQALRPLGGAPPDRLAAAPSGCALRGS